MTSETEEKVTESVKRSSSTASEWRSYLLLTTLYFVQGLPLGLVSGTLPFLLQEHLSYAQLATFSLASYPYSFKLLWSPVVDAIYNPSWGRRKSWIVPIQFVMGLLFLMWSNVSLNPDDLYYVTVQCFILVFLAATQDIAVDGWALTLLSPENVSHAGTCQSIGLSVGYFSSFTIFLAGHTYGWITLPQFMQFCGLCFVALSSLLIFVREKPSDESLSLAATYASIWRILTLRNVRSMCLLLLISKVSFAGFDHLSSMKLVEKGYSMSQMAMLALIEFPFEFVFTIVAGKWAASDPAQPLRPWYIGYALRLAVGSAGVFIVYAYPNVPSWLIIANVLAYSLPTNFMFVSQSAFFAQIADPSIGGTYLTMLNTASNMGGTWHKYFTLMATEYFTVKMCIRDHGATQPKKCHVIHDGYYVISSMCVLIGIVFVLFWVRRSLKRLQADPLSAWYLPRA
jgi:hypothetical protein